MAVNGLQPFIKVTDSNGNPIVGAKLYVYEAGTTTSRAIYSDDGLSVAISNPLTGANASNASGDFPRFYMAAGTYKLRAETSTGALIWEYDDIDTGTSAGAGALPIANGGTSATTAAAARAALDVPSNSELTALSDTIATFTASLQNIVSQPQGRLTPTSATPIITTGVTAGTALYYTPYTGNLCPIYDGAQFNLKIFAELTLTLTASFVLNSHYDCFIIDDSGTVRIVAGPAWTTITAGSGARGSGAGTTELTRVSGLLVNANAMATARNGASTYSVDANKGTYVGSIYIDGTAGQITCHIAYGQSRKWGIWNAYNRVPIFLKAGDATASWNYLTNTTRAANGSSANSLTIFSGLAEEPFDLSYVTRIENTGVANTQTCRGQAGVGYNSTSAFSGLTGRSSLNNAVGAGTTIGWSDQLTSRYLAPPALGINTITALENGLGADSTAWYGSETYMLLAASWRC